MNHQSPESPSERYITVDGVPVPYAVYSDGDRDEPGCRTLVLLPGISMPTNRWGDFAHQLNRRVISVGVPGPSETNMFPSLGYYAAFTAGAIEQLAGEDYDILGYSWGGFNLQQMLVDGLIHPKKVVLAAALPATGASGLGMSDPRAVMALMLPGRSPDAAAHIYGGDIKRFPELAKELGIVRQIDPAHHRRQLYAAGISIGALMTRTMLHTNLPPTLVVAGIEDPVIPISSVRHGVNQLRWLGRQVAAVEMPDGHGFLHTRPCEAAQIVDEFLGD